MTRLATDHRIERRRQIDTRIRQLPTRLSIPLVLCVLPSFLLLSVAPLVLASLSQFSVSLPQSLNNERGNMLHQSPKRSRGQATTEYALILLVAAIIALLVIAWATAGGGAGKIGSLFDTVFNDIFSRASNSTP